MIKYKYLFIFPAIVFLASCGKDDPVEDTPPLIQEPILIQNCDQSQDLVWENHNPSGVDYVINCEFVLSANLIIQKGTTIQMSSGSSIRINAQASITAIGTETERIVIEGSSKNAGHWIGVRLENLSTGEFSYCNISDAGQSTALITGGCVLCSGPIDLKINNCILENSANCAINFYDNSGLVQSNNEFVNINEGPICPAMSNGEYKLLEMNTGESDEGDCTKNLDSGVLIYPQTFFNPCADVLYNGGNPISLCLGGSVELNNMTISDDNLLLKSLQYDTNFPGASVIGGNGGSSDLNDYTISLTSDGELILTQQSGCKATLKLAK